MNTPPRTPDQDKAGIGAALGRIPSGLFILTARHEERAGGMLASWVQQVCFEPPMIIAAIAKGRPILPLISDSRRFGLCQIPEDDRLLTRKFASSIPDGEDPFLSMEMIAPNAGDSAPLLANALAYLDCEVVCHMDVEGDHDLFVGKVHRGAYLDGKPQIRLRTDGFKY